LDKKKLDVWVHDLTVKNLTDRISICKSLLKRNKIEPFLKRLITGNEKNGSRTIIYEKSWSKQGKAPRTVAKPGLMSRKVMRYMMGLEKNRSLRAAAVWSND